MSNSFRSSLPFSAAGAASLLATEKLSLRLPDPSKVKISTPIYRIPIDFPPIRIRPDFAPAWFHSAVNWIGKSYYDSNNVRQRFNTYLIGSSVNPYEEAGPNQLFTLSHYPQRGYTLRTSTNVDIPAFNSSPSVTSLNFPESRDLKDVYLALKNSPIFSKVNYVYIFTQLTDDFQVDSTDGFVANPLPGYYPDVGIRVVNEGSALIQVIPVGTFEAKRNIQVYTGVSTNSADLTPLIIPTVNVLVYSNIQSHKDLNDGDFDLPTFYSVYHYTDTTDASQSGYYVNKMGNTAAILRHNTELSVGPSTTSSGKSLEFGSGTSTLPPAGSTDVSFNTYQITKIDNVDATGDRITYTSYIGTAPNNIVTDINHVKVTGNFGDIFGQQRLVGFFYSASSVGTTDHKTYNGGIPMYDFGEFNSHVVATGIPVSTGIPAIATGTYTVTQIYSPWTVSTKQINGNNLLTTIQKLLSYYRGSAYNRTYNGLANSLDRAVTPDLLQYQNTVATTIDMKVGSSTAEGSVQDFVDSITVPVSLTVTSTPTITPPPPKLTLTVIEQDGPTYIRTSWNAIVNTSTYHLRYTAPFVNSDYIAVDAFKDITDLFTSINLNEYQTETNRTFTFVVTAIDGKGVTLATSNFVTYILPASTPIQIKGGDETIADVQIKGGDETVAQASQDHLLSNAFTINAVIPATAASTTSTPAVASFAATIQPNFRISFPPVHLPTTTAATFTHDLSVPQASLIGTGITSLGSLTYPPVNLDFSKDTSITVNLNTHLTDKLLFEPQAHPQFKWVAGVHYTVITDGVQVQIKGNNRVSSPDLTALPANLYVGEFLYNPLLYTLGSLNSIPVYKRQALTVPIPTGIKVLPGITYTGRYTVTSTSSGSLDVYDVTGNDISPATPVPLPVITVTPEIGTQYVGSFTYYPTLKALTLYSVPAFLTISKKELQGHGINTNYPLSTTGITSGSTSYTSQVVDSSLVVFTSPPHGTTSSITSYDNAMYLSMAVINSSPVDASVNGYKGGAIILGTVENVLLNGNLSKPSYVFIPAIDYVKIGSRYYTTSIIELQDFKVDPDTLPYPAKEWSRAQYLQLKNKNNPYADVDFVDPSNPTSQTAAIDRAAKDIAKRGAVNDIPKYLHVDRSQLTYQRPIFGFSLTDPRTATTSIISLVSTLLAEAAPTLINVPPLPTQLLGERLTHPNVLLQHNPYSQVEEIANTITTPDTTVNTAITIAPPVNSNITTLLEKRVIVEPPATRSKDVHSLDTYIAKQDLNAQKSQLLLQEVKQRSAVLTSETQLSIAPTFVNNTISRRRIPSIYGFLYFNSKEAYIVEVVMADLSIPDRLPLPKTNKFYDPHYVRFINLKTQTHYNMTIMVPTLVHTDMYNLAKEGVEYINEHSKVDNLDLGYLHSLYDAEPFDRIKLIRHEDPNLLHTLMFRYNPPVQYLYTNVMYDEVAKPIRIWKPTTIFQNFVSSAITSTTVVPPLTYNNPSKVQLFNVNGLSTAVSSLASSVAATSSLATFSNFDINAIRNLLIIPITVQRPNYFLVREFNWDTKTFLTQVYQDSHSPSLYKSLGAGDVVPLSLNTNFIVNKKPPQMLFKLTQTIPGKKYLDARTITLQNKPLVVALSDNNLNGEFITFSLNPAVGTADIMTTDVTPLKFPKEVYIVGQQSTTLTSVLDITRITGSAFNTTGDFVTILPNSGPAQQQYQVVAFNGLVYLIRAVSGSPGLKQVGDTKTGSFSGSGLLVDTFVLTPAGNLAPAQEARHKRSRMRYFGSKYTPTTMVEALDGLDYTDINGNPFYVPTIFIPIETIDATKGFVADISSFVGQTIWTFIYPEVSLAAGVSGDPNYANGYNYDDSGKPILSLQKLHFVYDNLAVMFTPNDFTHKYPLLPKQQILALTNEQIREGIHFRHDNPLPYREGMPTVLTDKPYLTGIHTFDANIVYNLNNIPITTPATTGYLGASIKDFISVSGVTYNIEESALSSDQTGVGLVSMVSSNVNMMVSILFEYDNSTLGDQGVQPDTTKTLKGIVYLNAYLGASGFTFTSPDHFDVNDIQKSNVPLLSDIANKMGLGWDAAFYDSDISLPRQFWSFTYDSVTPIGGTNWIPTPPSLVDPTYTNRTRSLILHVEDQQPTQLGLVDSRNSAVACAIHLLNGVTASVMISKKADRDMASLGTNPTPIGSNVSVFGMTAGYDFFVFSRDHYWTLKGAFLYLIDNGYAMVVVDDGAGNKVAKYYVDASGNYYESYTYVLFGPNGGIMETNTFNLQIALGSTGGTNTLPTNNTVNPQDLVLQLNKTSAMIYATFGAASQGSPPATMPIQSAGGNPGATPIIGPPGFSGYAIGVMGVTKAPMTIKELYSGSAVYPIAGATSLIPNDTSGSPIPFYGSLSHGLDRPTQLNTNLESFDKTTSINSGTFGGDGLGSMIGLPLSYVFTGKSDTDFTVNTVTGNVVDANGKTLSITNGYYFVDSSTVGSPTYYSVSLPKFTINGTTYTINPSSYVAGGSGVTPRSYTVIVGGKSYKMNADNQTVVIDNTLITIKNDNTVVYQSVADSKVDEPTTTTLTPLTVTGGGNVQGVKLFQLNPDFNLTLSSKPFTYNPATSTIVSTLTLSTSFSLAPAMYFNSNANYAYILKYVNGGYTQNDLPAFPYSATVAAAQHKYPIMTDPQIFTDKGNFYVTDPDPTIDGGYASITSNGKTYPINPYQFSINGKVYIINTNIQHNTIVGEGVTVKMTNYNTQFMLNDIQYTILLNNGSLKGSTVSGQYNISQGNIVILENYVYQLDTLNGQIVGNGKRYPLTTNGFTYTITGQDIQYTVTTTPNSDTVEINHEVYQIGNNAVVVDGINIPILTYRTFQDATSKTFILNPDNTVTLKTGSPLTLTGTTFTDPAGDGGVYQVNIPAVTDGTNYYSSTTGTLPTFNNGVDTYTYNVHAASITSDVDTKTYFPMTPAGSSPTAFTINGTDYTLNANAAWDRTNDRFYEIVSAGGSHTFADTSHAVTYSLSGSTARSNTGSSYELFSMLGSNPFFTVPGTSPDAGLAATDITYFLNIAVAHTGSTFNALATSANTFPQSNGNVVIPITYTIATGVVTSTAPHGIDTISGTQLNASGTILSFKDDVTGITYNSTIVGSTISKFVDSNGNSFTYDTTSNVFTALVPINFTNVVAYKNSFVPGSIFPMVGSQFTDAGTTYNTNVRIAYSGTTFPTTSGNVYPYFGNKFVVPSKHVAYTVNLTTNDVIKSYLVTDDNSFTVPIGTGSETYTINEVNATSNFITPLSGTTFTDPNTGFTYTVGTTAATGGGGSYPLQNGSFFIDTTNNVAFLINTTDNQVTGTKYFPINTAYTFKARDNHTYLIDYSNVDIIFPVNTNVNAGVATVGANTFTIIVDGVKDVATPSAAPGDASFPKVNTNSFEINGNLYTIVGSTVHGNAITPVTINALAGTGGTFTLSSGGTSYTLLNDVTGKPLQVRVSLPVIPSANLISITDDVYSITYTGETTGLITGQGKKNVAIADSQFGLTNIYDPTTGKYIFNDQNIYNAGSVIATYDVNVAPTAFINNLTYTIDTANGMVTDSNKRDHGFIHNPQMLSIDGVNYVIDTNYEPHHIVGNNYSSPTSTNVTSQQIGSTQTLMFQTLFSTGGHQYYYIEDSDRHLLMIFDAKVFLLTAGASSTWMFNLDTSINNIFNPLSQKVTIGGNDVPVYLGTVQSNGHPYFIYNNSIYLIIGSGSGYSMIQKVNIVYTSHPTTNQQQLAIYDKDGWTYLVDDDQTNPPSLWVHGNQFGVVMGPTLSTLKSPLSIVKPATKHQYSNLDSNGNNVIYDVYFDSISSRYIVVDTPSSLPLFTQIFSFGFVASYPLTIETGGYNAFTTFVSETNTPVESFAGAFKTPITSNDPNLQNLISKRGDFSVGFWHSLDTADVTTYNTFHPFSFTGKTGSGDDLVKFVDIAYESGRSTIIVSINDTLMLSEPADHTFHDNWRHLALTYEQPYAISCTGDGFKVNRASAYNFNRAFSIGMTFSVQNTTGSQGLLYKGTGSSDSPPEIAMSYRVTVEGDKIGFQVTEGTQTISDLFTSTNAKIEAGKFYQLVIVKNVVTVADHLNGNNTDPYLPPFNASDLGNSKGAAAMTVSQNGSNVGIGGIKNANSGTADKFSTLLSTLAKKEEKYSVSISIRETNTDGTFGPWLTDVMTKTVTDNRDLSVMSTGNAHLLIGEAYNDAGAKLPFTGWIRKVFLFNAAIDPNGVKSGDHIVDIGAAGPEDLVKAGLVGYWVAKYSENNVIENPINKDAVAISNNSTTAILRGIIGHEFEGANLYINGYPVKLSFSAQPPLATPTAASSMTFRASNINRMEEISVWSMQRQNFQIIDDMFGRLIPSNEPYLVVYLSGAVTAQAINAPLKPMSKYVDNILLANAVSNFPLQLSNVSLDLNGCPAVGRFGPIITPNLYTPPNIALTVADSIPYLSTYSLTTNTLTGTLAGEINEMYVYITAGKLTLYAGKKVGDLILTWVSQEQGDVQIQGFIEGAPPCPMSNLTVKGAYAGATSVTFTAPTQLTLKYQIGHDSSNEDKFEFGDNFGIHFGLGTNIAPFGFGVTLDAPTTLSMTLNAGGAGSVTKNDGNGWQNTPSLQLSQGNTYKVSMQGTLAPITTDSFMSSINTLTTNNNTAGGQPLKTPILPNPNTGGFTSANGAGALPKSAPNDEKFGARMYVPSPYGTAYVTSKTLDVYQQTLIQSNTVYGYVRMPNSAMGDSRDVNIVSFKMSSKYIRPGNLSGKMGYIYNPATLVNGAQTYSTSTGQMAPLYDKNFSQGDVGHNASYMKLVEAYQLKRQIDEQAAQEMALYQSAYDAASPDASKLTEANYSAMTKPLDFYNEYVWSSKGGTEEVKHTFQTTYEEVYTASNDSTTTGNFNFNAKIDATAITVLDFKFAYTNTTKSSLKYQSDNSLQQSFDIAADFSGIETDTQMRNASNNDAHFILNNNSMYNPNNQNPNLVSGSDGLVYTITPSVQSGGGLPTSDNIDDAFSFTQPPASYTNGNANGLTGNLEAYDRPGKVSKFRSYAYFLQPRPGNTDDLFDTVIDPNWLANSQEPDAKALRDIDRTKSVPWRLLYRVTYVEEFLPPLSTNIPPVPKITPIVAVPVTNSAADFIFKGPTDTAGAHNPNNDLLHNIVLAVPTKSGKHYTPPSATVKAADAIVANNVIPFDVVKNATSLVNWGDTANSKLITSLVTSALGLNTLIMTPLVPSNSTKNYDVKDPFSGNLIYTVYTDGNGMTINVPTRLDITVYVDVNSNPIQYYDGKVFKSLQNDYIATSDGTIMYYIQPPAGYDQTKFDLTGDYDLYGKPGDQWRYYLVSGFSSNMTSDATVVGTGPFLISGGTASPVTGVTDSGFTGFTIATSTSTSTPAGYVLVQTLIQYPHLNTTAESFADLQVYRGMSLLDTFPIGDVNILINFLDSTYKTASFSTSEEIKLAFAKNIITYFNSVQQGLIPQ